MTQYQNAKLKYQNHVSNSFVNVKSRAIVETVICTIIAVVFPAIFAHAPQNQFIVGPIVNAVLFWVALRVGITNALFIAVIPSLIALFRGLLPPTSAPVVPFIILGNCAMILAFSFLKSRIWLGVFAGSTIKTLVIFLPVWLFLNSSPPVTFMMSWPQLVTAIVGGFVVIILNRKSFASGCHPRA
ncbi:MAG: hypothetical protein FJZ04_02960 [Candidatus Moranbacteria bacterium]|nr:hypothetical protein [Candidatus Moranbacteria bacterium]